MYASCKSFTQPADANGKALTKANTATNRPQRVVRLRAMAAEV